MTHKESGGVATNFNYSIYGDITAALSGSTQGANSCDGEGRRFVKFLNGAPSRHYLYNELGQLVGELDGNGALSASFHYASQSHSPDLMLKGGVKYYFVKDHLRSVRLVVNFSNGNIAQRIDYDGFGQILSDSNPGFQPFGFAGGLYDHHTKLVRFGARDYDPEIGRWTSKDPTCCTCYAEAKDPRTANQAIKK